MKPTVVLFDVDGTLITTGGAGRRAIERAYEMAFGEQGNFDFPFGGMTDRAIMRAGLSQSGRTADDEAFDAIMAVYLDALRIEVSGSTRYFVHPGIEQALDGLRPRDHVAVGLGTGNIEPGARIKLERAALNEWFSFGGFGCDAEDRAELIAVGARRGAEQLGCEVDDCRLVIIGDTPKDVAAAHANGGVCVAVATGGATAMKLWDAGADWVVPNLTAFDLLALVG